MTIFPTVRLQSSKVEVQFETKAEREQDSNAHHRCDLSFYHHALYCSKEYAKCVTSQQSHHQHDISLFEGLSNTGSTHLCDLLDLQSTCVRALVSEFS